jgi:hypothetical protein
MEWNEHRVEKGSHSCKMVRRLLRGFEVPVHIPEVGQSVQFMEDGVSIHANVSRRLDLWLKVCEI